MAAVVTAPSRYFTYAPGKAPAGQGANQVKLAPGQSLHFAEGKGYYAGPSAPAGGAYKPRVPTPPPPAKPYNPMAALSPAAISAQADTLANSQLLPQQQEIERQQALADEQARANEESIKGFSASGAQILAGLGPDVGAGITQDALAQGQVGAGLGKEAEQPVDAAIADQQAFAESQGQSGGTSVDSGALGNTVQNLNGQIPGDQLASEALSARIAMDAQPKIALDAGAQELHSAMAKATADNDQYAQQLIQLAATFPGLKAQALTQLNQYEVDKANYRQTVYANETQRRAEIANEKLAGLKNNETTSKTNRQFAYDYAKLKFQNQQAAAKAAAAGKTIDVGASRLLGHVVYKDGSQDPSIKVQQTTATSPAAKAKVARTKALYSASTKAYAVAVKLAGTPVANKNVGSVTGGPGKYMADPAAKGKSVFPPPYKGGPRTTNDLTKAARTGQGAANYQDAFNRVYAAIGGDALIAEGLSKDQVNTLVRKQLVAAGWRPGK